MLAGGFNPSTQDLQALYLNEETKKHARDWLTESADVREFRDRWVSGRDLFLEIVVIILIGWEISLSISGEHQQARNFDDQQKVLTAMQQSTKDTAAQLALLKSTTEEMSKGVERNAKAAEASSATAAKSLVISERAYVSAIPTPSELKAGEKFKITNTFLNSGKTPAISFITKSWFGYSQKGTSVEDAYKQAIHEVVFDESVLSKSVLGPGQPSQQFVESGVPLTEADIASTTNGTIIWYIFIELSYNDTFSRPHVARTCNRYDPDSKKMLYCRVLNTTD